MQCEVIFFLDCPQRAEHPRESQKPRHSENDPLNGYSALSWQQLWKFIRTPAGAPRDAVNMLADQLLPNVPKLDGNGNTAQEEPQVIQ